MTFDTTHIRNIYSFQFPFFEDDYEKNLKELFSLLEKTEENSVILAPELCLSNFSFSKMKEAADFGKIAIEKIKPYTNKRIFCFTLTQEINGLFYNSAMIIYNGKIIHTQSKANLFKFGEEDKYFTAGDKDDIKIIEIDSIKIGILICFEIRFIDFWKKLQGCDILLVPSLWGIARKSQYEAITRSIAIVNQCFVVASNSSNDNMAASSGIITPFGEELRDDSSKILHIKADLREIKKMRKYMDVGIK